MEPSPVDFSPDQVVPPIATKDGFQRLEAATDKVDSEPHKLLHGEHVAAKLHADKSNAAISEPVQPQVSSDQISSDWN